MAVATAKTRTFQTANELVEFLKIETTVVLGQFEIVRNEQSNSFVLFWW